MRLPLISRSTEPREINGNRMQPPRPEVDGNRVSHASRRGDVDGNRAVDNRRADVDGNRARPGRNRPAAPRAALFSAKPGSGNR